MTAADVISVRADVVDAVDTAIEMRDQVAERNRSRVEKRGHVQKHLEAAVLKLEADKGFDASKRIKLAMAALRSCADDDSFDSD